MSGQGYWIKILDECPKCDRDSLSGFIKLNGQITVVDCDTPWCGYRKEHHRLREGGE